MAPHSGISTSSVGRIWRALGLQPHRVETFKLSTDPLFVDKRCYGASGEDKASSSLDTTDGDAPCRSRMT
jgi:hypothetical protein